MLVSEEAKKLRREGVFDLLGPAMGGSSQDQIGRASCIGG